MFRRRCRKQPTRRQKAARLSAGKEEGVDYEAVIEKNGKEWGVKI